LQDLTLLPLIDIVGSDIDLGDTHCDYVGASIGVAQYPLDGSSFDELLHKADAALYEVKHSGRNGYCIYDAARLSPVILARDDVMERR
jgi:GGDEF domain-containing protein